MEELTEKEFITLKNIKELEFQLDRNNWISLSYKKNLSEDFIREFKDEVYWIYICEFQKLSENFIIEFENYLSWEEISCFQKLSEAFITEYKDKVDWYYISKYQKLSDKFIRENISLLNKKCLLYNKNISEEIKQTIRLLS